MSSIKPRRFFNASEDNPQKGVEAMGRWNPRMFVAGNVLPIWNGPIHANSW
jgi:hypothetical protein